VQQKPYRGGGNTVKYVSTINGEDVTSKQYGWGLSLMNNTSDFPIPIKGTTNILAIAFNDTYKSCASYTPSINKYSDVYFVAFTCNSSTLFTLSGMISGKYGNTLPLYKLGSTTSISLPFTSPASNTSNAGSYSINNVISIYWTSAYPIFTQIGNLYFSQNINAIAQNTYAKMYKTGLSISNESSVQTYLSGQYSTWMEDIMNDANIAKILNFGV